jgi:hypothetical protein
VTRSQPSDPPADPAVDAEFIEACVQAVTLAAHDLDLDARDFVGELAQGEIGLLIRYLREAAPCVEDMDLRTRIDALLHRLTAWTGK